MGLDDDAVGAREIARWTDQAERLGRALGSSALAAQHASSDEMAWLFRHTLMGTTGDARPSAVAAPPVGGRRDRVPARGPGPQRADVAAARAARR